MKFKHLFLFLIFIIATNSYAQDDYIYPMGIPEGEDEAYNDIPQKAPLTRDFYEGSPTYFSLKKYAPTPKSQGQYGTCAGWAVGYAARTILQAQKKGWTDKYTITKNAYSGPYQYRLLEPTKQNCWGAYTSQLVASLKTHGAIPMKDFYAADGNVMCPNTPMHYTNRNKASKHKIESYATLWQNGFNDRHSKISRTKASLSQGNPVVISMICPKSFHHVSGNGLWIPTESPNSNPSNPHGRHAMCVVGYDNNKFGGAFEIQNSWGTQYGNKGYVWVRYNDFAAFVYQALELVQLYKPLPPKPKPKPQPRPKPKPKPQPKPQPVADYFGGSLRLYDIDDQANLPVSLAGKTKNWNIKGNEGKFTYKVIPELLSGSEMRIYLKNDQPAYVYMLGTGSVDTKVMTLFPLDGISPIMNYRGAEVAIPSEEGYPFEMDDTEGTDYIMVLFSKEALDIEDIRRKIDNEKGHPSTRLTKAFGHKTIGIKHIKFEQNEIKFKVKKNNSGKKAFAMIIEFKHVGK